MHVSHNRLSSGAIWLKMQTLLTFASYTLVIKSVNNEEKPLTATNVGICEDNSFIMMVKCVLNSDL